MNTTDYFKKLCNFEVKDKLDPKKLEEYKNVLGKEMYSHFYQTYYTIYHFQRLAKELEEKYKGIFLYELAAMNLRTGLFPQSICDYINSLSDNKLNDLYQNLFEYYGFNSVDWEFKLCMISQHYGDCLMLDNDKKRLFMLGNDRKQVFTRGMPSYWERQTDPKVKFGFIWAFHDKRLNHLVYQLFCESVASANHFRKRNKLSE